MEIFKIFPNEEIRGHFVSLLQQNRIGDAKTFAQHNGNKAALQLYDLESIINRYK